MLSDFLRVSQMTPVNMNWAPTGTVVPQAPQPPKQKSSGGILGSILNQLGGGAAGGAPAAGGGVDPNMLMSAMSVLGM